MRKLVEDRYDRMRNRIDELSKRVAYLEGQLEVASLVNRSNSELIERVVRLELTVNSRRKRA